MGRPDAHASPFFQYISNTCRANALAHLPIYFQYLQGLAPIPNINPCRDGKPSLSWSLLTMCDDGRDGGACLELSGTQGCGSRIDGGATQHEGTGGVVAHKAVVF